MPCAAIASMCTGRSRRARRAPCTAGCKVLTRPSGISVNAVIWLTSSTSRHELRSAVAVPPVERIFQPRAVSPFANSTSPVLSDTERRAVGIDLLVSELRQRRDEIDDSRIHRVLYAENAGGKRLGGVRVMDRNPPLRDNRTAVVFVIHKVHRDSALSVAGGDNRLMHARAVHAGPAVLRQKSGVNVDDSAGITRDDGRGDLFYISGENDQICTRIFELLSQRPAIIIQRERFRRDAGCTRHVERRRISLVREDDDDLARRGVAESRKTIDECLEIGAAAGGEDGDTGAHPAILLLSR